MAQARTRRQAGPANAPAPIRPCSLRPTAPRQPPAACRRAGCAARPRPVLVLAAAGASAAAPAAPPTPQPAAAGPGSALLLVGFKDEEAAALQDGLALGGGAVAAGEVALLVASAAALAAGADALLDRVRGFGPESDAAAAGAPPARDPMGSGAGVGQGRVQDGAADAAMLLPASRGGDGRLALLLGPCRAALFEVQVGAHPQGGQGPPGLPGVGTVLYMRGAYPWLALGARLCLLSTTHTPRLRLGQQRCAWLGQRPKESSCVLEARQHE